LGGGYKQVFESEIDFELKVFSVNVWAKPTIFGIYVA